jgi:hypothetical protein
MNRPICKNGRELSVGCGKNSENPFKVCEIKSVKSFIIAIIFWYKYTMEHYSEDGVKVIRRKWYYAVQWFENFLLFTTLIAVFFGTPEAILSNKPFFDLIPTWCLGGLAAATVLAILSVFFDEFSIHNAN